MSCECDCVCCLGFEMRTELGHACIAVVMSFWFSQGRNLYELYEIIRNSFKAVLCSSCHPPISTNISSPLLPPSLVSLLSLPQSLTEITSFSSEDSFRACVNLDLQSLSLKLHLWHNNIKYLYWFTQRHVHPLSCFLAHSDFAHVFQVLLSNELMSCPTSDIHLLLYHKDILLTKS